VPNAECGEFLVERGLEGFGHGTCCEVLGFVGNRLVATAAARFRRLRSLPIVVHIGMFAAIGETKDGLQGKTLKRLNNVSVFYHRNPNDDYRD
jgi:hypothetical protein